MAACCRYIAVPLLVSVLFTACHHSPGQLLVVVPPHRTATEDLASREASRYLYLRTGSLPMVRTSDSIPKSGIQLIVVSSKYDFPYAMLPVPDSLHQKFNVLGKEQFVLVSFKRGQTTCLALVGGDEAGTLYAAYRFAETVGVRFYLDGDVVPDRQVNYSIPWLNELHKPLFDTRGILPFHDFPEGPDWWNLNDYKAIIAQLPKLGMNFIGLHTYPENGPNAEPTVWIGEKQDMGAGGKVNYAYPSSYQSTIRGNWGYQPENTGDFHFGARLLFETDHYSADVMRGLLPAPIDPSGYNDLFTRTGVMLHDAFSFAHILQVKTCVGTETPLTIPRLLKDKLLKEGKNPADPEVVKVIYEGIFERIKQTYPIDYYWLWTPEGWTWDSVPVTVVRKTAADLILAQAAATSVQAPFTLATCGWVLGPPGDRGQFDRLLPKNMPFSCINRYVGFAPVEPAFSSIKGRPLWAIPWLEDDPGLTGPQLWAGRMRRDAKDALNYGCSGLLGIHWRTEIIGPNVSALARAAWDQEGWSAAGQEKWARDEPVKDFYLDWATAEFGYDAADSIADIFTSLDGGPLFKPADRKDYQASLYRSCTWIDGPGAIRLNHRPWEEVKRNFDFIGKFERQEGRVKGELSHERYAYWHSCFLYSRSMAQLGCLLVQLDSMVKIAQMKQDGKEKKDFVSRKAIPLRIEAAKEWGNMVTSLLSSVNSTGEMGTVANLEEHNLGRLNLLEAHDSLLVAISGKPLPAQAEPWLDYRGPSRMFLTAKRTLLEKGEGLLLRLVVLTAEKDASVSLYLRPMGHGSFRKFPFTHLDRGVYMLYLNPVVLHNADFEYYIKAALPSGAELLYPVSAPSINQTVLFTTEGNKGAVSEPIK